MIEKLTAPHWNDLDLWNKINDLTSSHNELEERVKKLEAKDENFDKFNLPIH